GNISANIVVNSSGVNVNTVGTYTLTYNVSDSSGNTATQKTRTVSVVDTVKPVITPIGADTVGAEAGLPYTDAGATATDNYDGNITARIVIANPVDTSTLGTYTIRYNVADASGNIALEKTRTVRVTDTISPTITRNGSATITVEYSSTYVDAGATATDSFAGNLTANIVTTNSVNTGALGSYTVRYNVSDPSSNVATEVTRTVSVVDTTKPVITRNGSATVMIEYGSVYTDAGATATDNVGGNITANIVVTNPVNTSALGTYTVRYNITDSSGNIATEVTRAVNVADTTKPVITRLGASPINAEAGTSYTDAGATATDNVNGNITANIAVTNPVNINSLGSYTVRYNVSDTAGNAATEVTRVVNVADTTKPVITRNGSATISVEKGTTYTDAGATASDSFAGNLTSNIVVTNPVNVNVVGSYVIL
ncbi:MAG: DUF5011 domain-containing protein, partial [Candidatus Wolfebacteria bacterium]|nr:DUF5011 domain-containing protein [Candidatus Wolfebacteria bacterium]